MLCAMFLIYANQLTSQTGPKFCTAHNFHGAVPHLVGLVLSARDFSQTSITKPRNPKQLFKMGKVCSSGYGYNALLQQLMNYCW